MTVRLDKQAEELMSRVWPKYTAAAPKQGEPVDVYRAERDAYANEINTSDAKVKAVEVVNIPGPAGPLPLRVYHPLGAGEAPLPILLYIHGGGWTVGGGGTLDATYRTYCAAVGCLLVTPDYRLAPEHKFPAAVDDCWAAACWVTEHGAEIGGDPTRIAVGGESSGGNLAAVLSSRSRSDPKVKFVLQALVYPCLDLRAQTRSYIDAVDPFTRDKLYWYIDCYVRDAADRSNPLASPALADSFTGLPKTMLISGGADPLLDESETYADALREAGVELDYLCLEGWPHGFAFWSQSVAYQQMMAFLTPALRSALGLA